MHGDLIIPISTLLGFLLVLTRLSCIFIFVNIPGQQTGYTGPRALFCLALTIALAPQWPSLQASDAQPAILAMWLASEAALGLTVGLAINLIGEAFVFGAQVLSLQAGFGYVSIVDPSTQADSGILVVVAQLLAGLLFFAFGLDREVLRALAASLISYPPGAFSLTRPIADEMLRLVGTILNTGLRLALPIVGIMLLIDIALGVLGRLHSQVQLLQLSFPVKLMMCLSVLGGMLLVARPLYSSAAHASLAFVRALLVH
jgi:flagellar biosynthetic protein FliR